MIHHGISRINHTLPSQMPLLPRECFVAIYRENVLLLFAQRMLLISVAILFLGVNITLLVSQDIFCSEVFEIRVNPLYIIYHFIQNFMNRYQAISFLQPYLSYAILKSSFKNGSAFESLLRCTLKLVFKNNIFVAGLKKLRWLQARLYYISLWF